MRFRRASARNSATRLSIPIPPTDPADLLTLTSPPFLHPSSSHNLGLCQPWTICEYKDVDSGQSVSSGKRRSLSLPVSLQDVIVENKAAARLSTSTIPLLSSNTAGNR